MERKIKEREDRPVPGDSAMQLRGSREATSPGLLPCLGPASSCPPLTDPGIRELWAQPKFLDINGSIEEQCRPGSYRQNCEGPSGQQTSEAKLQSVDCSYQQLRSRGSLDWKFHTFFIK